MLRRYLFVRKYHGSTGKGTLAMDEMLELANRFYSQFPKVRTLEAFARQGNYIGLAIMCKRMVLSVGTNTKYQSSHVYRSGSTPKIIAEKVKIYEIFTLLRTSHVTPLRRFKKDRVWNAMMKSTTILKNSKLESQMNDYTNDQAFQFLSSVGQILDELVFLNDKDDELDIDIDECVIACNIRDAASEAVNEESSETIDGQREEQIADDDANRAIEPNIDEPDLSDDEVSKKLGYNRFMIRNIWRHGAELLEKDNIKQTRMAKYVRQQRKMRVNRAIMESVAANNVDNTLVLKEEKNIETPPWRSFVMNKFSRFYA